MTQHISKFLSRNLFQSFDLSNIFYILFIFVPTALILDVFFSVNNTILFAISVLALIPLAKLVGDTTEHLAEHYGNTGGSLINVSFSNTPEIILSIVAIQAGLFDLVRANIVGSILGQLLLVFGLSLIVGGLKFKEQNFNRKHIIFHLTSLLVSVSILSIPLILIFGGSLFTNTNIENQLHSTSSMVTTLTNSFAFLLITIYILGLFFTFKTHKHIFSFPSESTNSTDNASLNRDNERAKIETSSDFRLWSKKKAIGILAMSMIGITIISEILVGSVEETITQLDLGILFVGAIVIGIAGNVPEKVTSMMMARRGKLDLSIGIAASSASQIALFVLPVIIIASMIMGITFPLIFTPIELISIFISIVLLYFITYGERSNWFQGVILVGFFIAIALGFYFVK